MWNKATVKVDKDKFLAWVKDNEIQMNNVIEVGDKINLDGKLRSVESHTTKNGLLSIQLKEVKQKKSK